MFSGFANIVPGGQGRPSNVSLGGAGARPSGGKKRNLMMNSTAGENVFGRLTSGVSGLNGTQAKVKVAKNAETVEAYDLEGDLSSAQAFQNNFRRSFKGAGSNQHSLSNSSKSRESRKNVAQFDMAAQGEKTAAQVEDQSRATIQIDNQAENMEIVKNQRPAKRQRPPRLPPAAGLS